MNAKERRRKIAEHYAVAREWLYFARALRDHARTRPDHEQPMWLAAVCDRLILANQKRMNARRLRAGQME